MFVVNRLHGATNFILRPDLNVSPAKFTLVFGIKGKWSNKPVSAPENALAVFSERHRVRSHRRPPPRRVVRIKYNIRDKYLQLTPEAIQKQKKRFSFSDYTIKKDTCKII